MNYFIPIAKLMKFVSTNLQDSGMVRQLHSVIIEVAECEVNSQMFMAYRMYRTVESIAAVAFTQPLIASAAASTISDSTLTCVHSIPNMIPEDSVSNMPSSISRRTKNAQTYLDTLPDSVLVRILRRLSPTNSLQNRSLAPILHAFAPLRNALQSNLSEFRVHNSRDVAIFQPFLHDSILSIYDVNGAVFSPLYRKWLTCHTLRKVHIHDDPAIMNAVMYAYNVTDVEINIRSDASCPDLISLFRALDIRNLKLQCRCIEERCIEQSPLTDLRHPDRLPNLIPRLRHLEVEDLVGNNENCSELLKHFAELESMTINSDLHEDLFQDLVKIPNIRIVQETPRVRNYLSNSEHDFPANIVELRTKEVLDAADFLILRKCKKLTVLDFHIDEGDESALVDLIRGFESLRTLKLTFDRSPLVKDRLWRDDDQYYYDAIPGVLRHVVRNGKKLEELALINVSVQKTELVDIIETVGSRMRSFKTCITRQGEDPCERLIAVLKTLSKCCPRLKEFDIAEKAELEEGDEAFERDVDRGREAIAWGRRLVWSSEVTNWGPAERLIEQIFVSPDPDGGGFNSS